MMKSKKKWRRSGRRRSWHSCGRENYAVSTNVLTLDVENLILNWWWRYFWIKCCLRVFLQIMWCVGVVCVCVCVRANTWVSWVKVCGEIVSERASVWISSECEGVCVCASEWVVGSDRAWGRERERDGYWLAEWVSEWVSELFFYSIGSIPLIC